MKPMKLVGRWATVAVVAGSLGACHSYAEVDPDGIAPGSAVRLEIERQEAVRQVERLGSIQTELSGTLREATAEALGLTIRDPNAAPGERAFQQYIEFPRDQIIRVEEKRLDLAKTGLLAAGAGLVTWLILEITEGSSMEGPDTPGPDAQRIRVPVLRFGG